jgi:hypothetical protein
MRKSSKVWEGASIAAMLAVFLALVVTTHTALIIGGAVSLSVAGANLLTNAGSASPGVALNLLDGPWTEDDWTIIYAIFFVVLSTIVAGYWLSIRSDEKKKPQAKQKCGELQAVMAELPQFAMLEFTAKLSEAEGLFDRKQYKRSLRHAEAAMAEVKEVREVIDQTRASIATSETKLQGARALGLEISEEALGLTAIKRELGGG